jgi:hypothetical protein
VAVLAALLFGETLGPIAISGLGLGIVGLILLEVHVWQTFASFSSSTCFYIIILFPLSICEWVFMATML